MGILGKEGSFRRIRSTRFLSPTIKSGILGPIIVPASMLVISLDLIFLAISNNGFPSLDLKNPTFNFPPTKLKSDPLFSAMFFSLLESDICVESIGGRLDLTVEDRDDKRELSVDVPT